MVSLITGSGGACAHYLKDVLIGEVHGIQRPDCDLTKIDQVCAKLDEVKPDVIYHLASDADVRQSFDIPQEVIQNNVIGTVNLFEACRKVGIKPTIQICSSSEVYGNPGSWPINEDFPIAPVNPYAVSKAAQDILGAQYAQCYGFRVVRTRAFGYVNPKRKDLSLSSFARQIVNVESGLQDHVEHGFLESVRTFCDVRDIAEAYRLAAEREGVFNIGATAPITVGGCLEILISLAKVPIKTKYQESRSRPSDVTNQIPDCSRFQKATGWEPKIPLKDSLRWLLACMRIS